MSATSSTHGCKRGEDRPTLCYGVDRAHAEHLQQRFLEAGVAAEYIDCFTDNAERERIFRRFDAGTTRIICNVGTLTTGFDRDVRCIIDAKPTKSEILFVQTIGRGLRTADGKDKLIVLDHAGNHLRLGLVTDIHHEHLTTVSLRSAGDARQREVGAAPAPVRLLQGRHAARGQGMRTMRDCPRGQERRRDGRRRSWWSLGRAQALHGRRPHLTSAAFLGELRFIAGERGYSDGWAAHKFREKFRPLAERCLDAQRRAVAAVA